MKPPAPDAKDILGQSLRQSDSRFARGFAQPDPTQPLDSPAPAPTTDPDLVRILDAWPQLPAPIRRAILALVESGR
jgi:hypothetical protein